MIARNCHFYSGWTVAYCLALPVKTFFAMHKQAVLFQTAEYSELADIALIGNNMKISYYESVKDRYRAILDPESLKIPPRPGGPVLEAGSPEAMDTMISVGRAMKRFLGYGRR